MAEALSDERIVINLVNSVCSELGIQVTVNTLQRIDAKLIKDCFVRICGLTKFKDNFVDDISVVKNVLDTLSKSLELSLSHITPEAIISQDVVALKNLFEVFSELIFIQLCAAPTHSPMTNQDVVLLLNHILGLIALNKKVKSIDEVNSFFFEAIFRHLRKEDMRGLSLSAPTDEGNYGLLLQWVSLVIKTSLDHIDPRLLARKNLPSIVKLVEIVVGVMEGVFSDEKQSRGVERPTGKGVVKLANSVAKLYGIHQPVKCVSDVDDRFFTSLYDSYRGPALKKNQPLELTDNSARNIRVVVDSLSGDVLHAPLTHINPSEVASGNITPVKNLLEIFEVLGRSREDFLKKEREKAKSCEKTADEVQGPRAATNATKAQEVGCEKDEPEVEEQNKGECNGDLEDICCGLDANCCVLDEEETEGEEVDYEQEVGLPTMEEIVLKYGPKRGGLYDEGVQLNDGSAKSRDGRKKCKAGFASSPSSGSQNFQHLPGNCRELMRKYKGRDDQRRKERDDNVEMLRETLKKCKDGSDLSDYVDEACRRHLDEVKKRVQLESDKTKSSYARACQLSSARNDSTPPPSEIRERLNDVQYLRSMLKKHCINLNPQRGGYQHHRPNKTSRSFSNPKRTSPSKEGSSRRKVQQKPCRCGRLMSYLVEEHPSIDIPLRMKDKICKQSVDKEKVDGRLLRRMQIKEAQEKQHRKLELMKKDVLTSERLRSLQEKRCQQSRARVVLRNKKIAKFQAKKCYDELRAAQQAGEARRRSCQQQALHKFHIEGLRLQREMMLEERKREKERRMEKAKNQVEELASIENYYRDQFALLSEVREKDSKENRTRDQEQAKLLREMKYEMRKNMEEEIKQLQEKLLQDQPVRSKRQPDVRTNRQRLLRSC